MSRLIKRKRYKIDFLNSGFIIIKMTFDSDFYLNLFNIKTQSLVAALEGGITIAIAASLYYSFFGKILGISGLVGNLIKGKLDYDARRSLTILSGLIFSAALVIYVNKHQNSDFMPFDSIVTGTNLQLIISGALVGLGTQLGSGCTSGHGLCGLPRLSPRSFTAVIIFLITGIITATFSLSTKIPYTQSIQTSQIPNNLAQVYYLIGSVMVPLIFYLCFSDKSFRTFFKTIIYFFIGAIFGFGLMLAGMTQRSKIYAFLELNKHWDPSLLIVLMTGVVINLIIFTIMRKQVKKPLFQASLSDTKGLIDGKLIIGAFLFGLGWGIGGLCPGPFLLQLPLSNLRIPIFWGLSFISAMKIGQILNPLTVQIAKLKRN